MISDIKHSDSDKFILEYGQKKNIHTIFIPMYYTLTVQCEQQGNQYAPRISATCC